MNKDDGISLFLSIIINIIIIILIPALSVSKVENAKLKVGLVNYNTISKSNINGKKVSQPKAEKNKTTIVNEKTINKAEEKKLEEIKNEKTEKEKVVKKEDKKEIDLGALDKIARENVAPTVDILTSNNFNSKKEVITAKEKTFTEKNIKQNGETKNNDTKSTLENGKDDDLDRVTANSTKIEGLPSGYKLGTEDGDILAKWDARNKEPVYPEIAEKKGLHGAVKLKLDIDDNGNVKSLSIIKSSGVPEINNAIEQVGRTWKIYLSKNGINVKGVVILEYNFVLK